MTCRYQSANPHTIDIRLITVLFSFSLQLAEQEECWRLRERGRSLSPLGRTIQQRLLTFTADPSAVLGSMKSISRAKAKKAEEEREKTKKRKKKSRFKTQIQQP